MAPRAAFATHYWVGRTNPPTPGCAMGSELRMGESASLSEKTGKPDEAVAGGVSSRRLGDLLVWSLIAVTAFQIWFCFGDITYYLENGLFELSQDGFLFAGAVLFFAAARRAPDRVSLLSLLALAMFCLSVLFREMDVRGTSLEPWFGYAFQHRWHYAFLGVLWIAILLLSLRHFRLNAIVMLNWLFGLAGATMVAGILFYILGDFAEKHFFTGNPDVSEMIEESMEQIGTLFIFLSAWLTSRRGLLAPTARRTS